jgi:hypothetical protein
MTDVIQTLIVAVAVACAALYAAGKYVPLRWRERIVHKLSGGTGKGWYVKWFGTDASCGSGCDTCGSCETPAPLPEVDDKGRKIIELHVKR